MAIRIQFAGDKSIGVGSRPPGAFSIFKPPGAAFPPAGTYNSTLYLEEYPVAEGGTDFAHPITSVSVPNQTCTVDVLNDGSGGTYIDWTSVRDVVYKAYEVLFHTEVGVVSAGATTEVPDASSNYYTNGEYADTGYYHDGFGWYYTQGSGTYTYYTGLIYAGAIYQTEVPSGSNFWFDNGTYPDYYWDGSGGYTTSTDGSYYPSGDFIWNDGSFDYYWDGNGGYYL